MLRKLIPRLQVNSVFDIELEKLWHAGIRGIITDLDNTLVGAKVPLATPELVEWLKKVRAIGFQIVIVSNNHGPRVSAFAEPIAVPFIYRAKKPFHYAFRRAMDMMELGPAQTAVVGDQLMTDVLGGNRLGLYTILVQPIALRDEGVFTKLVNRRLEKAAFKLMKKPGRRDFVARKK